MATSVHTSNRDSVHFIRERINFKASTMFGQYETDTTSNHYVGQLPDEETVNYFKALERTYPGHPIFVVYSYATPIAWWSEFDGWYIPEHKYSVTTSKHQTYVRRAVA